MPPFFNKKNSTTTLFSNIFVRVLVLFQVLFAIILVIRVSSFSKKATWAFYVLNVKLRESPRQTGETFFKSYSFYKLECRFGKEVIWYADESIFFLQALNKVHKIPYLLFCEFIFPGRHATFSRFYFPRHTAIRMMTCHDPQIRWPGHHIFSCRPYFPSRS